MGDHQLKAAGSVSSPSKGTDVFTPEKRSEIMSRVKSKDTKPELFVRSLLHTMGYRFRLHRKDLPGSPDIVLPKHRTAIFVHGCFWHQHPGCPRATLPQRNAEFWKKKLEGNVERDSRAQQRLKELGWNVLILWQCEIKRNADALPKKLNEALRKGTSSSPINRSD